MNTVLRSIRRNAIALRKSRKETRRDYHSRLLFELRRRSNQLMTITNPFAQSRYRREKLVGPIGVWSQLERYQFNALSRLGLKPEHSIADIGCGPLAVGLALIAYLDRGNYVGIDALPEPLVEAYRRIAEHSLVHKNPALICSSGFGKHELAGRTFDYLWMSQLSYHLDDARTEQLFEQARSMMSKTSVFLLDIIDPEMVVDPDDTWRGFPYFVRPVEFYEAMARRFGFSIQSRGRIVDYGYPDKINLSANMLLEFRRVD